MLRAAAAAALLAGASAGCAPFLPTLGGITEATDLYLLTPKSTFPEGLPRIPHQLIVETPTATAGVNSDRIAVQPNPLALQFLPGARWVDRAPLMVQTLLVESFENSNTFGAVGRSAVGLRADYLLVSELREFHARVRQDDPAGPLEAHVRLNVKIVDAFADRIVASESFERMRVAESEEVLAVIAAFDDALGATMREAVVWTAARIAEQGPPRRF